MARQMLVEIEEFRPWSGGCEAYKFIEENGLLDAFYGALNELCGSDTPTDFEINDLLWFETEDVFDAMGIKVKYGENGYEMVEE